MGAPQLIEDAMTAIDLAGKSIIVSGAGSGLGQAMTLGLAGAGASVLAIDIDPSRIAETVQSAKALDGQVVGQECDVRSIDSCETAVKAAIDRLGGLTGLVNCAGIGMPHLNPNYISDPVHFWKADPSRWQDVIDVNVRGPFLLARAVAPTLLERGWGRIVNVTTSFNTMIRGANMPYGQSKAALEAASNSWSEDLKDSGVTCNVLVPGGAANTRLIPEESPYDRDALIQPDVMIRPIIWLMSDLSDGVNGQRFVGRYWAADADWQTGAAASGAPIAWPELAAKAAQGGQPKPKGGYNI